MERFIKRFDVYFVSNVTGTKEEKRPCIVISNNMSNIYSSQILVIPVSVNRKASMPTHVEFAQEELTGVILTEQIRCVSREEMCSYICTVKDKEVKDRVEHCIKIALGMESIPIYEDFTTKYESTDDKLVKLEARVKNLEESVYKDARKIIVRDVLAQSKTAQLEKEVNKECENSSRRYVKRSKEEIKEFIREWEDPASNRADLARIYKFSTKKAAYTFYTIWKDKINET